MCQPIKHTHVPILQLQWLTRTNKTHTRTYQLHIDFYAPTKDRHDRANHTHVHVILVPTKHKLVGVVGWCGSLVWVVGVAGWLGWLVWLVGVVGWCGWLVWLMWLVGVVSWLVLLVWLVGWCGWLVLLVWLAGVANDRGILGLSNICPQFRWRLIGGGCKSNLLRLLSSCDGRVYSTKVKLQKARVH